MRTKDIDIGILVSMDIWENIKSILLRLQDLENPDVDFCTHSLTSYRGTLGYGTQTYDPLIPFVKGSHLTIYGCRPGIVDDG